MKKMSILLAFVMVLSLGLVSCGNEAATTTAAPTTEAATTAAPETEAATTEAPAEEEVGGGFEEFDIGDAIETEFLTVAGVYFQPVVMEPAGNSIPQEEADCHIEADIAANEGGTTLGYGLGDFVPWLTVKAKLQKEGSDNVQEIAFMPMNASDGPHYGANIKFEDGFGVYNVKFEISAPGNDYLLHVDPETGVTGRFWTEPIIVEWPEFEWNGPQW